MSPSGSNALLIPTLHRDIRQKVVKGEKEEKNSQKSKLNPYMKVARSWDSKGILFCCTFRSEESQNLDGKVSF